MNISLVMFTAGDHVAELVHAGQSFSSNTWRAFDADTVMVAKKSIRSVVMVIYIICVGT